MHNDHDVGGRDDFAPTDVPMTTHQRQHRIAAILATAIGRMREERHAEAACAAHPDGPEVHLELCLPSPLDRDKRGENDATRTGELQHEMQHESQEDA